MTTPDNLVNEVAQVILKAVNLRHVDATAVGADTPLMSGVLNLDSIDVLEAVVAVENHFNVKLESAEQGKKHFQTIGTIAAFIQSKNNGQSPT